MIRSLSSGRHILFGVLFAGCLAFGSAQAFVAPQVAVPIPVSCNPYDRNSSQFCAEECWERGYDTGFCGGDGSCYCRNY